MPRVSVRSHIRRREGQPIRVPDIPRGLMEEAEEAMARQNALEIARSKDRPVAFTGVIYEGRFTIGLAEKDVPGYTTITFETVGNVSGRLMSVKTLDFPSYDAASEYAEEMNAELGLSKLDAFDIVTSSMRAQNKAEAAKKRPPKEVTRFIAKMKKKGF